MGIDGVDETKKAAKKKKWTEGTLIIVWQALRLHQGGAEHPAERSASVVWLLCILLRLHSECQAPLNRTGSRSSWRQEQTPAGTEAGSHWGLAGLLRAERRPLPSTHSSVRPTGARQRRPSEGLDGCGCETLWKWSVHLLWGRSLSLSSVESYISRLCFRHVLFLWQRRLSASTVHGLIQKYQVSWGECLKNSCFFLLPVCVFLSFVGFSTFSVQKGQPSSVLSHWLLPLFSTLLLQLTELKNQVWKNTYWTVTEIKTKQKKKPARLTE